MLDSVRIQCIIGKLSVGGSELKKDRSQITTEQGKQVSLVRNRSKKAQKQITIALDKRKQWL